ncbi:MAG: MoaD/ThiS family protein [Cyanobacteria bacterium P01_F01_bin.42]
MKITVKLFAAYQEAYQQQEIQLDVAPGTTVATIGDRIRAPYPDLQELAAVTRYGLNYEFVTPERTVTAGDELVLIPPVSGG